METISATERFFPWYGGLEEPTELITHIPVFNDEPMDNDNSNSEKCSLHFSGSLHGRHHGLAIIFDEHENIWIILVFEQGQPARFEHVRH